MNAMNQKISAEKYQDKSFVPNNEEEFKKNKRNYKNR